MQPGDDDYTRAGGYPIGVVSTLTGLPVDVIRVWERRYGLVTPARSAGGHRLYSPRNVLLLRRAAALRAQGLTAAAACAQARAEAAPPEPPSVPDLPMAPHAAGFSDRLHAAALAMDAGRASAVLAEAAAQLDVGTLWGHVLAPALARLGEDWQRHATSPGPEHLLSSIVHGRLSSLLEALPRLPGAPAIVIATGPNERHDLGALALALLVARAGWTVTYLGADTPPNALEDAVRAIQPRLALLTATLPEHAVDVLASLAQVRSRLGAQAPLLAYGGPAFKGTDPSVAPEFIRLPNDVQTAARQVVTLGS
jgi:DNA-binding transcriptional MerR regulator/methylmalonyl-CoA mutase cobalamin-binding subunit